MEDKVKIRIAKEVKNRLSSPGYDMFWEMMEPTDILKIIEEFEKVKAKIDEESDSTASGIGAIFG